MRRIEAVEKMRYAQKPRAIGDQFEVEDAHARAFVTLGRAKYVGEGAATEPVRRGPGRPKKAVA